MIGMTEMNANLVMPGHAMSMNRLGPRKKGRPDGDVAAEEAVIDPPPAPIEFVHRISAPAGHGQIGKEARHVKWRGMLPEGKGLEELRPEIAVLDPAIGKVPARRRIGAPVDKDTCDTVVAEAVAQMVQHAVQVGEEPGI